MSNTIKDLLRDLATDVSEEIDFKDNKIEAFVEDYHDRLLKELNEYFKYFEMEVK